MDFNQLIELVGKVSDSTLTHFDYEEGNIKIHMGKKQPKVTVASAPVAAVQTPVVSVQQPVTETAVTEAEKPEEQPEHENYIDITAPIVGTFYAASGPDSEPFVKVGDHIEKGQVIGIIEAMKLMNQIESDESGIVKEILVKNGDGVEYGQTLIRVEKE